jgi:hypothetical protein
VNERPRIIVAGSVTHCLWQCPYCRFLVKHPWQGRHFGRPAMTSKTVAEAYGIVAQHIDKEHTNEQIHQN